MMEQITLDMIPNGYTPTAHISQYDSGRHIRFNLWNIILTGSETVTLKIRKTNGELVMKIIENHTSYVEYVSEKEDCDYSGKANCEIVISKDDVVIGSKNFILNIEADPYDNAGVITETASGRIATFETNIVDLLQEVKCEINAKQDLHGYDHPWAGGAGKNKLNYDAWKNVGVSNGTAIWNNNGVTITATDNDCFTKWTTSQMGEAIVPVNEGETIILSWQETENKNGTIYIFPNGSTTGMVSVNNAVSKQLSYTVESGVTFITFRFGVGNSGVTISYKNIQINKGTQESTWTPYSNVCPISGYSAVNLTACGVNLFNNTATSQTVDNVVYTVNEDKIITANGTSNGWNGLPLGSVSLPAGTFYLASDYSGTSSEFYVEMTINGSTVSTYSQIRRQFTLSQPSTGTIKLLTPNGTMANNFKCYPAIYQNNTDVYSAYTGNTYTIAFGQTVYGGQLIILPDRTYIHVTRTGVDLGSLTWVKSTTDVSGVYRYVADLVDVKQFATLGTTAGNIPEPLVCENYPTIGGNDGYDRLYDKTISGSFWNGANKLQVCESTPYADGNAFKTAMSGIMLTYELATPFDIDLTPVQIEQLLGKNNVYHDCNGDMEVKYLFDA